MLDQQRMLEAMRCDSCRRMLEIFADGPWEASEVRGEMPHGDPETSR